MGQLSGNSSWILGLLTAAQFGPVVLAFVGGRLAHRHRSSLLLLIFLAVQIVAAVALFFLWWNGTASLGWVFALAFLAGAATGLEFPVKLRYGDKLVPDVLHSNVAALTAVATYFGMLVGAAGVAWVLIPALPTSWVGAAFLVTAGLLVLGALVNLRIGPSELSGASEQAADETSERVPRFGEMWQKVRMLWLLVFLVMGMGWTTNLTLPLLAGGDSRALGVLTAAAAVGQLVGAVLAVLRMEPGKRTTARSATLLGVFGLLSVLSWSLPVRALALVGMGAASMSFLISASLTMKERAGVNQRPQSYGVLVLALYLVASKGGPWFSGPLLGWIGERLGPTMPWLLGELTVVVLGVTAGLGPRTAGSLARDIAARGARFVRWAATAVIGLLHLDRQSGAPAVLAGWLSVVVVGSGIAVVGGWTAPAPVVAGAATTVGILIAVLRSGAAAPADRPAPVEVLRKEFSAPPRTRSWRLRALARLAEVSSHRRTPSGGASRTVAVRSGAIGIVAVIGVPAAGLLAVSLVGHAGIVLGGVGAAVLALVALRGSVTRARSLPQRGLQWAARAGIVTGLIVVGMLARAAAGAAVEQVITVRPDVPLAVQEVSEWSGASWWQIFADLVVSAPVPTAASVVGDVASLPVLVVAAAVVVLGVVVAQRAARAEPARNQDAEHDPRTPATSSARLTPNTEAFGRRTIRFGSCCGFRGVASLPERPLAELSPLRRRQAGLLDRSRSAGNRRGRAGVRTRAAARWR